MVPLAACSKKTDDSGGGGGAGGDCVATPVQGALEDSQLTPHSDFDACVSDSGAGGESASTAPNSACSLEDFCAAMVENGYPACGSDPSMFDASGCRRSLCTTDEDCSANEHCFTTPDGVCLSTAGYGCAVDCDDQGTPHCTCAANDICGAESHCVPNAG
ncbi:MAG: hypothetical protein U0271_03060 [Polyangiaceae bacterium]